LITQTAAAVVAIQRFVGLTGPFRYIFIAWMVLVVGCQWWLPRGPFRAAAQRGGWRLAIAVLSSLSMLAFGIAIAVGHLAIAIAALITCAPPTWFLYIRFFRDGPQPERGNQTSD
jgi:hypothetical protein